MRFLARGAEPALLGVKSELPGVPLARVRYAAWLTITANRVHGWCSLPFFVEFCSAARSARSGALRGQGHFCPYPFLLYAQRARRSTKKHGFCPGFSLFCGGGPLGLHLGLVAHIRHRVHGDKGLGVLTVDVFHQLLVFPLIHNGNDLTVRLQIECTVCLIHGCAAVQVL